MLGTIIIVTLITLAIVTPVIGLAVSKVTKELERDEEILKITLVKKLKHMSLLLIIIY